MDLDGTCIEHTRLAAALEEAAPFLKDGDLAVHGAVASGGLGLLQQFASVVDDFGSQEALQLVWLAMRHAPLHFVNSLRETVKVAPHGSCGGAIAMGRV